MATASAPNNQQQKSSKNAALASYLGSNAATQASNTAYSSYGYGSYGYASANAPSNPTTAQPSTNPTTSIQTSYPSYSSSKSTPKASTSASFTSKKQQPSYASVLKKPSETFVPASKFSNPPSSTTPAASFSQNTKTTSQKGPYNAFNKPLANSQRTTLPDNYIFFTSNSLSVSLSAIFVEKQMSALEAARLAGNAPPVSKTKAIPTQQWPATLKYAFSFPLFKKYI